MNEPTNENGRNTLESQEIITSIQVAGFKSIAVDQNIAIVPLTILAGANNSGKSSMMQPLLLIKQTLEASYDPGTLLLNGPNVRFSSVSEMLSSGQRHFYVGVGIPAVEELTLYFALPEKHQLELQQMAVGRGKRMVLRPEMTREEISATFPDLLTVRRPLSNEEFRSASWFIHQDRCLLELRVEAETTRIIADVKNPARMSYGFSYSPGRALAEVTSRLIHLPGLRGNPERVYPVAAVGSEFPGTFDNYVASILATWQEDTGSPELAGVNEDLYRLGLTAKVVAHQINDVQVELKVARLLQPTEHDGQDLVNIADVGFGVSQTLPVVVALHVAQPGQVVYIEQPEIHLHPRAQTALAKILADAAKRGVRVVAETHSPLLILGIQTLVAEGYLAPDLVKLHWFQRSSYGVTHVTSRDLDGTGAFGDWPEDFADVTLEAQSRYLDAAESRLAQG